MTQPETRHHLSTRLAVGKPRGLSSGILQGLKAALDPCLYLRPIEVGNAEVSRVTDEAIGLNAMAVQRSFVMGAELADGGLAMEVSGVSLEGHAERVAFLEGMGQEQEFAFRIDRGSAAVFGVPSHADFEAASFGANVHERSLPNESFGLNILDRESDHVEGLDSLA